MKASLVLRFLLVIVGINRISAGAEKIRIPAFSNHRHPSSAITIGKSPLHFCAFPSRRNKTSQSIIVHSHSKNAYNSATSPMKRIVLIGGGHAHVQVIKSLNVDTRPVDLHVTLVDLQSSASYSGMVPGCVSKLYTLDQVKIALDSLAEWAGIEFVCGKVVGMSLEGNDDAGGKKVVLVEVADDSGSITKQEIPFDVVSIDIGSTTRDFTSIPGASEYTISTRPISDLVNRIEKEEELLKERLNTDGLSDGARVVVVGAGAAGIELSLAMRARWDHLLDSKLSITLIDSNDTLLPSENSACRSALKGVMKKYKIDVRHDLVVDKITSSHIHVSSSAKGGNAISDKIPYTHCIWATGAEAHELSWDLHRQFELSVSPDRGWIRVNQHLQSLSHPSIFAAGDCCEILNENRRSPPKAGVYAVRAGPILIENLTRFAKGRDLVAYHPQDDFLKLLMCGDGTALGFRFGIPLYGKWIWDLKDHIDQMFMDLFDVSKLSSCTKNCSTKEKENDGDEEDDKEYDTSQYDTYESRKERLSAEDAGKLLLRTDDDVDYQSAWNILREMMADEKYKEEVLRLMPDTI